MRSTGRSTARNRGKSDEKKTRPNWGQSQAEYLTALKGQQVVVAFADGKAMKGRLTGVDTFYLFIRQSSGLEVMIGKGPIKYLHPALNG